MSDYTYFNHFVSFIIETWNSRNLSSVSGFHFSLKTLPHKEKKSLNLKKPCKVPLIKLKKSRVFGSLFSL